MAIISNYVDQVQQVYIAYYGRPADLAGLDFWTNALDAADGNLDAIIGDFGTSAEAVALFGGLDNEATVNTLFNQLFGRDADAEGLAFYVAGLADGTMTAQSIALDVLNGASGDDATIVANKLSVAKAFTDALDTAEEQAAYAGDAAAASARASLGAVDAATDVDAFDVAEAFAVIDNAVVVDGSTFSLTSGTDRGADFVGTDNNDQFDAFLQQNAFAGGVSNSLSSADVLDGGNGTDSLYAELVPEFFGATGDNQIDVQPRTSNIENVAFEARDSGSNDVNNNTLVTVDAKNMLDVDKIGSYMSDGDLVIENLTTQQSEGADRNTDEITITMDHTDNFNSDNDASDLTVYFDEDYLLVGQTTTTSQANYWLLDENSVDYVAEPLLNIERNGVTLTIDGVAHTIAMTDAVAATKDTWDEFAAGLQDVITAEVAAGNTAFEGLSVIVDLNNTDSTFNDAGVEVTIPAITIIDAAGRALIPTGFVSPEEQTVGFDIYGTFDNVASTSQDNPLAVNVELDKVGREGEGGDLVVGGKELDQDGGVQNQGNGIGIFNVDVLGDESKLSNLGSINSTNNALTTVNIATGAAFVSSDTHASLTIRDAFDASTAMETVNANAFLGDLNIGQDDAALNVDTFTATGGGDVTYNAEIDGTEKGVFTNTTGEGDDTITVDLVSTAVDTVGTSFSVNAGNGDNTVTVVMDDDAISVGTTADLDNLSITTGSGEDKVTLISGSEGPTDGSGDFDIATGSGSDMVYINQIDDHNNGTATKGAWTVSTATSPDTFVDRVLYQATLTVNFAGFEQEVSVVTTVANNFVATQIDINNAIKAAIAANPELARLLTTTDGTSSQQLTINSTVEGNNDFTVTLVQPELVVSNAVAPQVNIATAHISALQTGLVLTGTVADSDDADTAIEIAAAVADGNLNETGAVAVGDLVVDTGDGTDGADATTLANYATIDMGRGANDLVVLGSDDDSANVLDFSAAWDKVSVVNFFDDQAGDPLTPVQGDHVLDFTAFIDDETSASGSTLSEVRVATSAAAVTAMSANTVSETTFATLSALDGSATNTWATITDAEVLTALQADGTYGSAAPTADLVGTTRDSMLFVENADNLGEYKVYNVALSNVAGTDATGITGVELVGVVDFGASIDTSIMANFA